MYICTSYARACERNYFLKPFAVTHSVESLQLHWTWQCHFMLRPAGAIFCLPPIILALCPLCILEYLIQVLESPVIVTSSPILAFFCFSHLLTVLITIQLSLQPGRLCRRNKKFGRTSEEMEQTYTTRFTGLPGWNDYITAGG